MSAAPRIWEDGEDWLWEQVIRADESGIKLEIVGGKHTWEFFPGFAHQEHVDRIRPSIRRIEGSETDCACIHAGDVYLKLPDGSIKRPDISIFCRRPDEMDGFITLVPKAVIEVISPRYEIKDLVDGPPLYLAQGVLDVLVYHPEKNRTHHFDLSGEQVHSSPVTIESQVWFFGNGVRRLGRVGSGWVGWVGSGQQPSGIAILRGLSL